MPLKPQAFADSIKLWFKKHGRHDLPWQIKPNPYTVWVSEIMLQQTQVSTVIPYFKRFIQQWPTVTALASAEPNAVLKLWSGLGYYARAHRLLQSAQLLVAQGEPQLPNTLDELMALPGIGRSTAGAILSLGFDLQATILDGNVKRVLGRYFKVTGDPSKSKTSTTYWQHATTVTPEKECGAFNQAMMDLGATLCTKLHPKCHACPLQATCLAYLDDCVNHYPNPTAKQPIKKLHWQLLLVTYQQSIALLQRPSTGIWAGLWSFIEDEPHPPWEEKLRMSIKEAVALEPLTHRLTHREIYIQPMQVTLSDRAQIQFLPEGIHWHPRGGRLPGGLPTPVQQLLQQWEHSHVT